MKQLCLVLVKFFVIVGDKDPEVLCVSAENLMGSLVIITDNDVLTISLSEMI